VVISPQIKTIDNVVRTRASCTLWQLREFKTDINAKGEAVFVADSVKSNPLAELFAKEGNQDSNSLKALRIYFARDFGGNFCIVAVSMATAATHCLSTIHNHFCAVI
jgi:hypothetical protein